MKQRNITYITKLELSELNNLLIIAKFADGQPLLLEDVEKDLPGNSRDVLMESKWTFITHEVYISYFPLYDFFFGFSFLPLNLDY